jgi:hypothetical protein
VGLVQGNDGVVKRPLDSRMPAAALYRWKRMKKYCVGNGHNRLPFIYLPAALRHEHAEMFLRYISQTEWNISKLMKVCKVAVLIKAVDLVDLMCEKIGAVSFFFVHCHHIDVQQHCFNFLIVVYTSISSYSRSITKRKR